MCFDNHFLIMHDASFSQRLVSQTACHKNCVCLVRFLDSLLETYVEK